jgi:hypothetical protein
LTRKVIGHSISIVDPFLLLTAFRLSVGPFDRCNRPTMLDQLDLFNVVIVSAGAGLSTSTSTQAPPI